MKHFPAFLTVILLCVSMLGSAQAGNTDLEEGVVHDMVESPVNQDLRALSGSKIAIQIGEQTYAVELYDNPTANDLLTHLPLTHTVRDYAGYDEKVIRLDASLSMKDAPDGDEPGIPELGYYEPGNWIAIYYGHIGYWSGKVPLGRINATVGELAAIPHDVPVMLSTVED